jgi:hypothetical protein
MAAVLSQGDDIRKSHSAPLDAPGVRHTELQGAYRRGDDRTADLDQMRSPRRGLGHPAGTANRASTRLSPQWIAMSSRRCPPTATNPGDNAANRRGSKYTVVPSRGA